MTEHPKNPLMRERAAPLGRAEKGSETALAQLEMHCAALNSMGSNWHWAIVGEAPNRRISRIR